MINMLEQVAEKGPESDRVEIFFKAFKEHETTFRQHADTGSETQGSALATPQPHEDLITKREMEILELLARHLYNKEIAEQLFISPETVKTHLKRVYEKLMVSNRRDAVAKARKLGLIGIKKQGL